jgi:predicted phage tail protein
MAKLHMRHAKEREKIQLSAEKEKARVVEKTQKQIRKEERLVSRKANLKAGLAFSGAAVLGGVMLITELFTLGLLTLSTSIGGLSGYLLRVGQTSGLALPGKRRVVQTKSEQNTRIIEHHPDPQEHRSE